MIEKNYAGLDGFIWWMGVVESRQDPLKLGRCQVRVFNWHSPKLADIPSENLPWAHPVNSLNSSSFTTPRESDMVFGFFADGRNGQVPIIIGVLPYFPLDKGTEEGFRDLRTESDLQNAPRKPNAQAEAYPLADRLDEPTLSRLAVNKSVANTVIAVRRKGIEKNIAIAGGGKWGEPFPGFNAKYPYNQVTESESGHAFEIDDTPNDERVSINHRTGTGDEYLPSGSKIEKITKNKYEIILNDEFVLIKGECNITIGNDANIKVNGKALIEANELDLTVKKDLRVKAANIKIESDGKIDIKSSSDTNIEAGSKLQLKASSKVGIGASIVEVPAGQIKLQSGSVSSAAKSGLSAPTIKTYSREDFTEPSPQVAANFAFEEPEEDSAKYVADKVADGTYNAEDIAEGDTAKAVESDTEKAKDIPPLSTDCKGIDKMTSFDLNMQLSPNFKLNNLINTAVTKGQLKAQHGLTLQEIVCNLKLLCINVLEPIKKMYPDMIITSAFRNPGQSVSKISQHEKGMAADIQIPSYNKSLEKYYDAVISIKNSVPHDQLLLEYTTTSSSAAGTWIHVSFNPAGNRAASASNKHMTMMNHKTYKAGFHKLKTGAAPGTLNR